MKTIKQDVSAELTVKKSKFISHIFQVNTETEAKEKIKEINKKYYDAKHNCYAYIVDEINEDGVISKIEKSSDNGEPSGTAGAPMLDILKKQNISNVVVIVTRYFGGVLLGTGGLVKAYSDSVKEALNKIDFCEKDIGKKLLFKVEYSDLKDFEYNCNKINANILETKYNEKIDIIVEIALNNITNLENIDIKYKNYEIIEENVWIECNT